MNGTYYQNPTFPTATTNNYTDNIVPVGTELTMEQSYIENILRLNRGKMAKFHITVPGSIEWQDRVFNGIIEQSGRDHIIVSNPNTGEWYLILMIYLDFVTFEEPINYNKEFIPNPNSSLQK